MDCKTAVSPETAHRPTRGRGRRLPSLSPLLLLAALVLAGCGWPGPVAMPRVVAVAGTAELESRYAEYGRRFDLSTRPEGSPQAIAEAFLQQYQPGPAPRVFQHTVLTDREGKPLGEMVDEGRRTWLPLSEISPLLQQAIIATEDAGFYTNDGVDDRRLVGAIVQNVRSRELISGGSTITMQLARNLFFGPALRYERSLDRKLDEIFLAQDLTKLLSKDEILEMYLNLVYFGHRAYGAEAAAQTFLGASAAELTLAEAALLAGLPQQPANLDPFYNLDGARARQRIVLDLMVRRGYITAAAADAAFAAPLLLGDDPDLVESPAPHFVPFAKAELARLLPGVALGRAGLVVATTLDLTAQQLAQQSVSDNVAALRDSRKLTNGALVALRPNSGEIVAMVGSTDFNATDFGGQVNVVLRERQPGSSIKPMLYAAALEAGVISPATLLWDLPVQYPQDSGRVYVPRNYDGAFRGPVTVRGALANSLNVPTIKLIDGLGVERFRTAANAMGVNSLTADDTSRSGIATALGAGEVTLLDLAAGYLTLASEGSYWAPRSILRVTVHNGAEVTLPAAPPQRVVSTATAFLVTDILADNDARSPIFGANSRLRLSVPAAAKTGTTTDYRDNWTLGYTRYLLAGVWAGNNDNTPMQNVDGVTGAGTIWNAFMEGVLADPELRALLGMPTGDTGWSFSPPDDVLQIERTCPAPLRCRPGGEYFARTWIEATQDGDLYTDPYMDAFASGLLSEVYADIDGRRVTAGFCLQESGGTNDPGQRSFLMMPAGIGFHAPSLPTNEATQPATTTGDATGAAATDAAEPDIAFGQRLRDEQRAAIAWAGGAGQRLVLGRCAGIEPFVRAMYDNRAQAITISDPLSSAALAQFTQPVSGTNALTDTVVAPSPTPVTPGQFAVVQQYSDTNCPGTYVMGKIVLADGAPVAGVRILMRDQWGNEAFAVSKSGSGDAGLFDFPVGYSARELYVTAVDDAGNPLSQTVTIRHLLPEDQSPCHHIVLERVSG
jgi:penicillin-binding protein 1C